VYLKCVFNAIVANASKLFIYGRGFTLLERDGVKETWK
jgi:hypothetical protein